MADPSLFAAMEFQRLLPDPWGKQWGYDLARADHPYLRKMHKSYAGDLNHEANVMCKCILNHMKELKTCSKATMTIAQFMELRYCFSPYARKEIVERALVYILDESIDTRKQGKLMMVASRLLRRKKDGIIPNFTIDWRPIYKLLRKTYFPKQRASVDLTRSHADAFMVLMRRARRYFSEDAAHEILKEIRPMLCPHDLSVYEAVGALCTLLPSPRNGLSAPSWWNEMLVYWSWGEATSDWNTIFFQLFKRIARDCRGHIDWGPILPSLFSVFLQHLDLPVGTVDYEIPGDHPVPSSCYVFFQLSDPQLRTQCIAKMIIYMLSNDNEVMAMLERFFSYIESYYHPSNEGPWTETLACLLLHLTAYFSRRLEEEGEVPQYGGSITNGLPPCANLQTSVIKRFVSLMFSVTIKGVYCKNSTMAGAANNALKHLAFMAPQQVLPAVLDRVYGDLECLSQSHRALNAIEMLGAVARPLLWRSHFPPGGSHLLRLLTDTLPGIDPNDLVKTHNTLHFVVKVLYMVPLVDCTTSEAIQAAGSPMVEEKTPGEEQYTDEELEEWHVRARECTSGFTGWALRFLGRCYSVLSLHHPNVTGSDDMESSIGQSLVNVCEIMFAQSSDELYKRLINKMMDLFDEEIIMPSLKFLGMLCGAANRANPVIANNIIIPRLYNNLIKHTSGELQDMLSHNEIIWNLRLLSQCTKKNGPPLLKRRKEIEVVLRQTLRHKKKEVRKQAGTLLRNTLKSLLTLFVDDRRSVPQSQWNDNTNIRLMEHRTNVVCLSSYLYNHYRCWGAPTTPETVEISYHTPNKEELEWAITLIKTNLAASYGSIEAIVDKAQSDVAAGKGVKFSTDDKTELMSAIEVIRQVVRGGSCLLEAEHTVPLKAEQMKGREEEYCSRVSDEASDIVTPDILGMNMNTFVPEWVQDQTAAAMYKCFFVRHPDAQGVLKHVKQKLWEYGSFLLHHCEDDTTLLRRITRAIEPIFIAYGFQRSKFINLHKTCSVAGRSFVDRMHGKNGRQVRSVMVGKIYMLNVLRMFFNKTRGVYTLEDDKLVNLTYRLSLHAYPTVRVRAQDAFIRCLRQYHLPSKKVVPILSATLRNKDAEEGQLMGCSYLLHSKYLQRTVLRDWRTLKNMMRTVASGGIHEKMEIQENICSLFNSLSSTLYTLKINSEVDKQAYLSLVEDLVEMEPSLHWRYKIIVSAFLEVLIPQKAELVSPSLALYFLRCLKSDADELRMRGQMGIMQLLAMIKFRRRRIPFQHPKANQASEGQVVTRLTAQDMTKLIQTAPNWDEWTESEWENANFRDKNNYGWNGFPHEDWMYAPRNEDDKKRYQQWRAGETVKKIWEVVSQKEYWDEVESLMVNDMSDEESAFTDTGAQMFKGFFQCFEMEFFDQMLPRMKKVARDPSDKGQSIFLATICAGVIRGSKHWSCKDTKTMWSTLLPLITPSLMQSTAEIWPEWGAALNFAVYDRDIRRGEPLVTLVLRAALTAMGVEMEADAFYDQLLAPPSSLKSLTMKETTEKNESPPAGTTSSTLLRHMQHDPQLMKTLKHSITHALKAQGIEEVNEDRLQHMMMSGLQEMVDDVMADDDAADEALAMMMSGEDGDYDGMDEGEDEDDNFVVIVKDDPKAELSPVRASQMAIRASSSSSGAVVAHGGAGPRSFTTLSKAKRLSFLTTILAEYSWRAMHIADTTIRAVAPMIAHPYKLVREKIANALTLYYGSSYDPERHPVTNIPISNKTPMDSNPFLCAFVDSIKAQLSSTGGAELQHSQPLLSSEDGSDSLTSTSSSTSSSASGPHVATSKKRKRVIKSILQWIGNCVNSGAGRVIIPHAVRLLPQLFAVFAEDENELIRSAERTVGLIAHCEMGADEAANALSAVFETLTSPYSGWHSKVAALPFLQVLVFRNVFQLPAKLLREDLATCLTQLLADTQLEVRLLASTSLGGLLRFFPESKVEKLKADFIDMLQTPLSLSTQGSKRRRAAASPRDGSEDEHTRLKRRRVEKTKNIEESNKSSSNNGNNRAHDKASAVSHAGSPSLVAFRSNGTDGVLRRHAGVLGIAAIILSHPYDMPDSMPELLVILASHIHDPNVIQESVRKTFQEFWRVHQDAWAVEKEKFTPQQLSVLTQLLVSPSYFA